MRPIDVIPALLNPLLGFLYPWETHGWLTKHASGTHRQSPKLHFRVPIEELTDPSTLMRAKQGLIVIANPGTFIGLESSSQQTTGAAVVWRLYTYHEASKAVASVPTCVFCEMPDPDHNRGDCRLRGEGQGFVICEGRYCKDAAEHNAKECPNVRCRSCGHLAHRTSVCTEPLPCPNCRKVGHGLDQCSEPESCHYCWSMAHRTWQCETVCRLCH